MQTGDIDPAWKPIDDEAREQDEILVLWPRMALDDDGDPTGEKVGWDRLISSFQGGSWDEPDCIKANGSFFGDGWEFASEPEFWQPLPPIFVGDPDKKP